MLDVSVIRALQQRKLNELVGIVGGMNPLYRAKLVYRALKSVQELPFTTRAEIEADQRANPPYGTNLTSPIEQYCRFHQTSGTSGQPVRWLDTQAGWDWFKTCWATILRAANVKQGERLMFPFS